MSRWLSAHLAKLLFLGLFLCFTSLVSASPKSSVPFEQALADAQRVASMNPAWQVLLADGDSMGPHFGRGSLLLVQPASLEQLREGMIAVYRDAEGDLVAHTVVQLNEAGVIARGFNNPRVDPAPIQAENLVGVAFGILHSNGLGVDAGDLPVAWGKTF